MNANLPILPSERTDSSTSPVASSTMVPAVRIYWSILRRHISLASAIVGLALILAIVMTFVATPQYTAKARIEVARQSANVTNVEGVEREEDSPSLEFYSTQYALLDTQSLARRISQRLRLSQSNEFFASHGESMSGLFGDSSRTPDAREMEERQRDTVELLLENVTIAPIRGSALIDVMYNSADPELSARIANAWVEEFAAQAIDRRFASTADAREFLEQRLAELRVRLEQSERDLVNYAARQDIVRLSDSENQDGRTRTTQTLASSDLQALNGALAGATAARIGAESQLRAVSRGAANDQAINNPAINQLREKRADLQAQYADLLVQFEPEFPRARAMKEQIDQIDAAIIREEARVRDAVRTNFEAASQQESALRARVDGLLDRLRTEDRASIQYNIYQREVDTNRQLYDALLQRYKEIGVAGVSSNNIAIVDPATVPDEPSSPSLPLNLALGLLVGIAVAVVVLIVLENLDEGVRDPEQLKAKLQQPVLGVIPELDEDIDPLEEVRDPKSELSEAYMTVRTNLALSSREGIPRVFAITSSQPAEGKSTTSLVLAELLARSGQRVVLIDLDMRRPRLDEMVGANRDFGMSNFLAGDDDYDSLLQPTRTENLKFVSAGPLPPSAAELLSGDRLKELLERMKGDFDHVIVDSAPVLGLSDAPLIARAVDGVLFVIQARATSSRTAKHALDRLITPQSKVIGTILTKFQPEHSSYGYGYGYSYRYGGEAHDEATLA